LEREVVEPAPPEHGHLPVSLGVAVDLEHVELAELPDHDDGEARAASSGKLGSVTRHDGIEDISVKGLKAV
jgi:hypothetical protein